MSNTDSRISMSTVISFAYFIIVVVAYILFYAFFNVITTSTVQLVGSLGVLVILSLAPVIYTIMLAIRGLKGETFVNTKKFALDPKTLDTKTKLQNAFKIVIDKTSELKALGVLNKNADLLHLVLEVESYAQFMHDKLDPDELTTLTVNTDLVEYLDTRLKDELILIEGLSKMPLMVAEDVNLEIVEDTYVILLDKFKIVKVSALY